MIWICETCAVETADLETPPEICAICDDERQWVPEGGSRWTSVEKQRENGTRIVISEVEPELWGLRAEPSIGIGQQTMVVRTPEGTILFDCVGYIDDAAVEFVRGLGPTLAIAASHPHMYGVQTEWAAALDVPVLVAERDREWVRRPERVEFYDDRRDVATGVTLHRVGGHFRGQAVLEWATGNDGKGVLLAGDAIFTNPDRKTVSFMRSYPNRLPLSGNVVQRLAAQVEELHFDRLYNNFGAVVPQDAQAIIRYSADRHTAWVRGDHDDLT
ncbi:hydrolase [Ornithinimicrobium faecis]|uniref:Hydrolase n=1 Tax=Ornithinimicrobium faecis TaxID=2934158 RepID=A0ABY4YYK0_9MICO|nr:hydrolase [Ornithinimicrobium sp. HY1793]USQ81335.1 hydrolase [Ornithinimicrobium sp. HY1793]